MKGLLFILLFLVSFSVESKDLQIFFSPSNRCENSIIKLINQSEERIDVVVYAINNDDIVEALKKAQDRGVKIRILTDRLQASNKYSKVRELYNYGINIRVHSKHKIEHNKFAVFDNNVAMTGSYNWTNPATEKNSENCVFFFRDRDAIEKYQNRFEYLWQINTKTKSDKWFEKKEK